MPFRALLLLPFLASFAVAQDSEWSQWRGPRQSGYAPKAHDLPVHWSETENVLWKTKLPSWSAATPVVHGGVIYLTTAEAGFVNPTYDTKKLRRAGETVSDKIFLLAINRKDGSVKWKQQIDSGNQLYRKQNSASPSPITDGKHVWIITGNGRLGCYTAADGKQVWQRDLVKAYGEFGLNHGYASTPLLHGDRLYIEVIHGYRTSNASYVLAVSKATGENVWKQQRDPVGVQESKDNYGTPQIATPGGKPQLVIAGGDYVSGHDLNTGKELWRMLGFNPGGNPMNRTIASTLVVGDEVIVGASRGKPYIGFRAGGQGDITGKNELWTNNLGPDVPTPASDGKLLYVLNDNGVVNCLELATGKVLYQGQRVELGTYSSSPLLADGKLYAINEEGNTSVIAAGPNFEKLGSNKLDGYTLASPIAVDNQLFIRTGEALYCIAKSKK